jgi:phosphomannomutase
VHVRGSNTEPIMRIIAEAPTHAEAEQLITMISALING